MPPRLTGLWRHGDFLKLWAGQTVSEFGTIVSNLAISFTAVIALEATPLEMSVLRLAQTIPGFLVGLFAGVWVDRMRRRPILIGCDLGRAVLLGSIPLAALFGWLRLEQLYLIVFVAGSLAVLFEVAYLSYLPTLIRRDQLLEGNSKLQASNSVAEVAGFGLAGMLVQALTAPLSIAIDAVSFLISAASLGMIRKSEPPPITRSEGPSVFGEIAEGLRVVCANPLLLASAGAAATISLAQAMIGATFILYVTRELEIEPGIQGVVYAIGGISALFGALAAPRAARKWGTGSTMLWAVVLMGVGNLCIPLAGGPLVVALTFLVAQQLLGDGAAVAYFVNVNSLRQSITPNRLLGRMNASIRFVRWSALLVGTLVGGVLGELIGVRWTLLVAAIVTLLSALWIWLSPLKDVRDQPLRHEP